MRTRLLVVLMLCVAPAGAQQGDLAQGLAGTWYIATNYSPTVEVAGQSVDWARSVVTREPNGEYTQLAYLYLGNKRVIDFVRTGRWGIGEGRYWADCGTVKINGNAVPCPSGRQEAVIEELTASSLRYRDDTVGSGIRGMVVNAVRVPKSFRLEP